ncbi:MAG: GNAT family N-acetyltransferase [Gemmatimonadetes bacterium]|nr:GNAT family N-acetyltransferase [Gemmatimonadota bacterium]
MTIAAGSLNAALGTDRTQEGVQVQCAVTRECPGGWDASVLRCQGGFFHSPPGIEVGGPPGETVYLRFYLENDVVAVAAGVRRSCRLSGTPRHVYFPTWPAVVAGFPRATVLSEMMAELRRLEAAELVVESFDAAWNGDEVSKPRVTRVRDEYVIPIETPEKALWEGLASSHRRQVRKGDRGGWRVEESTGEAARSLLLSVQELAARRAAARGNGFSVRVPQLSTLNVAGPRPWGATVFAAWQGDTPLAAALIGWANRRAFYVMGGSTAAGYERGASVWLHWQIARRLAESGFVAYNLGGASPTASAPADPSHGLHRFKIGFGSRVVSCRSMTWLLNSAHGRVHQLGRWLGATTSFVSET